MSDNLENKDTKDNTDNKNKDQGGETRPKNGTSL